MKELRRCFRSLSSDESGSSLVELATTTSLLMMSICGVMDCSRALYADHFVSNASTEAARYAMTRGATWGTTVCTTSATTSCNATSSNVLTFVKGIAPFGVSTASTALTVTTTWPGTTPAGSTCNYASVYNSVGCTVKVNVKYNYSFVLPFLPKNTLVLSSTAAFPIAQ